MLRVVVQEVVALALAEVVPDVVDVAILVGFWVDQHVAFENFLVVRNANRRRVFLRELAVNQRINHAAFAQKHEFARLEAAGILEVLHENQIRVDVNIHRNRPRKIIRIIINARAAAVKTGGFI